MPVVKADSINLTEVKMEGVSKAAKANIIGPKEGWKENTLRVFRLGAKGYTPHHKHDWEHINYVIKGRGVLTIGEETHELGAGDYALVPSGTMHQFRNPYDSDFEFICVVPDRGAY